MASRGVAPDEGETWLNPTFRSLFPDPSSFADMDVAIATLIDAVRLKRRLAVFADYDVDGATSAALLVRWFRALGQEIEIYVPDRVTEGYGPSVAAFRTLMAKGVDLVITVDCGAAAHEALDEAEAMGLEVVVIDHHLMRGAPPRARAVVNPNRPDCGSGQGDLAAAGVTFVLLAGLNRAARAAGLVQTGPDILSWADLAALGAVCDVTPLRGFNRALVVQGLKIMSQQRNRGLAALMTVAGGKGSAGVFHLGFLLGPRINAGGRVGRSDLGARLLSSEDADEVLALALELHRLNEERKSVEAEVLVEAQAKAEEQAGRSALVVAAEAWHPGVIGIVAARLRERFRKPVFVIGIDPASRIGKGSGRSQPGVNLGSAVHKAFDQGLILGGGGHAMSAGLSIRESQIPAFQAFLDEVVRRQLAAGEATDWLDIDAAISCRSADRPLLEAFARLEPYGAGNPEPVFAASDVAVIEAFAMRGDHVRVTLEDADGARLRGVAWRAGTTPLGKALLERPGRLHVAGRLRADDWAGRRSVQLEIEDAADPRRVA